MFKSALGYFAGANAQFGSTASGTNDLVGSTLELGNANLRVKRVIAEGGFAVVFEAADISTNKSCAVKRLLAHDVEKKKEIEQEIKFLKLLSGHPNIIRFITAASSQNNVSGSTEYLVVMEYCPRGRLTDLLAAKTKLSREEVICYFYQIARAVQHMHSQSPPIIHRDLKLENVLINGRGMLKLCDFGSATTQVHHPDYSWSALKRSQVEDEITSHTTPMYRTPEMLDLYQNFPIDQQQDIWALGCTLYLLSYGTHPFEDSAKLRILNANYTLENRDTQYEVLHDLIRGCLMVDPRHRPSVNDTVHRIEEIAEALQINLASLLKKSATNSPVHEMSSPPATAQSPSNSLPTQREQVPSKSKTEVSPHHHNQANNSVQESSGAMFNSFKSGASSFLTNMKEASNKMAETMANYAKGDLDISYITSRILVMSYPGEGIQAAVRNNIDAVRAFLDSKHHKKYAVYNLTLSPYRHYKFDNRVSDCGWPAKKSPNLTNLLMICKNMSQWLKIDSSHVAVIHCVDGKAQSALVLAAFFAYCNMYQNLGPSLHLFTLKRTGPGIIPSHRRYIEYVADICNASENQPRTIPHHKIVRFNNLVLKPVPLINSQKTGCKPFCEVYQSESRVFTTSQEYDAIPGFDNRDDCVMIPLEIDLMGDLTFIVYHARSILGGKVQAKNISLKMFQFQFNSGFLPEDSCCVKFGRFEIDYMESPDRYPDMFAASLNYEVTSKEDLTSQKKSFNYDVLKSKELTPYLVVKDDTELNLLYQTVGPPEARTHKAHDDDCFEYKNWGHDKTNSSATTNGSFPFNNSATESMQMSSDNALNATNSSNEDNVLLISSGTDASSASRASPQPDYENVAVDVPSLLDFGENSGDTPQKQSDPFGDMGGRFDPFKSSGTEGGVDTNFNLFADDPFGSSAAAQGQTSQPDPSSDLFGADPLVAQFDSLGVGTTNFNGSESHKMESPNLMGDWSDVINTSSQPGSINTQFSSQYPSASLSQPMFNRSTSSNLKPAANSNAVPSQNSKMTTKGAPLDPFGSLDPFGGSKAPNDSLKVNGKAGQQQTGFGSSGSRSRSVSPNPTSRTQTQSSGNQQSTTAHQQNKPNYNLNIPGSGSGAKSNPSSVPKTGASPKLNRKNDFSDLLGGFNVSGAASSEGPKTLKDLKNQLLAETLDPDEMKIRDWIDGKEGNIRGLLCSLHKVVWDESPWKECGMHQLVSASDVKKMWRKALLATHPDKQVGTANEKLAKMIMIELNDAWDKYQNSGAQSLYGN